MSLTEQEAPFTEAYGLAGSEFKSKGNTALAVKRALAHLGFLPWEPESWDDHWNQKVHNASAEWKRKRGIIPAGSADGSWGKKAHDTMRSTWFGSEHKPAFDGESQRLLQEEKAASGDKDSFDDALVEFCETAWANASKWNYTQNRAVDVTVNPASYVDSDCSGSVIQAYKYANQKAGTNVPDPSKYNYAGWGNTWDDEDGHPKVTNGQYRIGDLAHYDGHVCMCVKAGNADSADWWSFGSEPPSKRKLHYRSDFKFVVRPPRSPSPHTYSTTFERLSFALRFWKVQRIVLFWRNGKRRGDAPTDPPP